MYSYAAEELLLDGNIEELNLICGVFQYVMLNP